ncbi:hypothetical protein BBK14_13555 [Parafrankia soli]|uniref:Uncharacterized protein n=1 Tax=Parafrankia soli TaxID=2599596 RepID=A0A1S1R304_9ACTN|nr:hypothetical protein BBK14_13555 [Parafrankia soli]
MCSTGFGGSVARCFTAGAEAALRVRVTGAGGVAFLPLPAVEAGVTAVAFLPFPAVEAGVVAFLPFFGVGVGVTVAFLPFFGVGVAAVGFFELLNRPMSVLLGGESGGDDLCVVEREPGSEGGGHQIRPVS